MSMKTNHQLPLPEVLKQEYPLSKELQKAKLLRDQEIRRIFTGESDKFVVLVGPCSADNEDTVCEYVNRLKKVADKVSDKLMIIPRVYTNKPRTTGDGYKGMLHQPDPDKAPDLYAGIMQSAKCTSVCLKKPVFPQQMKCFTRKTEAIWMMCFPMKQSVHVPSRTSSTV